MLNRVRSFRRIRDVDASVARVVGAVKSAAQKKMEPEGSINSNS